MTRARAGKATSGMTRKPASPGRERRIGAQIRQFGAVLTAAAVHGRFKITT
jgi:hypothetical protein